jgi:hypothetical protein
MKNTIITLLLLIIAQFSFATETQIIVRAKAKDAKFIGSSIGGAYVIIRNQLNGEILAQGKTEGSTGNTSLIMNTAIERGTQLADDQTAKFLASIDIDEPTYVSVEVLSPINRKNAQVAARTELWLIPGKHILGDGIIIEIPGFAIDIVAPRTHQRIGLSTLEGGIITIQANIVMMCGCPINSGGLWNADTMEVKALIKRNGQTTGDVEMTVQSTSLFEGQLLAREAGSYEIIVYAYDAATGNTGVDKINFIINE